MNIQQQDGQPIRGKTDLKCFEYVCPLYPKCGTSGGSCCGVDDFFDDVTISAAQCFDLPNKPYYRPK